MQSMSEKNIRRLENNSMRYIDKDKIINDLPAAVITALEAKHQLLVAGDDQTKQKVAGNGNTTWSKVKPYLENASNRKCWYTESKSPGYSNDVEHFRPKGRIVKTDGEVEYWYWFLAFKPENYRLSCTYSNRSNKNPATGITGGKGDKFPLLNGQSHGTTKAETGPESPVILDPCIEEDCTLLEFQADGRPVVSPGSKANKVDCHRVEQSKLLLNLDFPTFNEDREALYNSIRKLVKRGDSYGDGYAREDIKKDLQGLMAEGSSYSKAAECYVRCFRDREWVERLFYT